MRSRKQALPIAERDALAGLLEQARQRDVLADRVPNRRVSPDRLVIASAHEHELARNRGAEAARRLQLSQILPKCKEI